MGIPLYSCDRSVVVYVRFLLTTISLLALLFFLSCERNAQIFDLAGRTMGTVYSMKIVGNPAEAEDLQGELDSIFAEINRQMSTWDENSEISTFNRLKAGGSLQVSEEFYALVQRAVEIWESSRGAFDISVGPLVSWWGFGAHPDSVDHTAVPDRILEQIGLDKLEMEHNERRLIKTVSGYELDMSAIAKGYAVDLAVQHLQERGINDFLVEIGGEIRTAGEKPGGKPWLVGIDRPEDHALPGKALSRILSLGQSALATSGDYRNFHKDSGRRYSHIIDPRNGRPVKHNVASVTVLSGDCATADALATAFSVLGHERSLTLLEEKMNDVEAYFIIREKGGDFVEYFSSGFQSYLYTGKRAEE